MSAITGAIEVGDLVWQQMYNPLGDPCIRPGNEYMRRRLMRVAGIVENYDSTAYARSMGRDLEPTSVTRWHLVDPERPNDESRMSWVESDWCVLEHAVTEGALF